ncbi:MAG TPA: glycosyltransferase family 87 protein [Gemmatimonadaceae bacterium]|nr:glycosyltransferase family 87 protein [Gemmatimonadaceae bacterium]
MTAPLQPSRTRRHAWRRWLLALYLASIAVVTVQKGFTAPAGAPRGFFRRDNNFEIFRASWDNLRAGRDLYAPHPERYEDRYKYSPTFAVLFAPFASLPLPLALLAWSALNTLLLWWAVSLALPERQSTLALALIYLDALRSMQRAQSNGLVAALVVLAFVALERRRQLGAAAAIAVGTLVKIFPLAALSMAVMHPRRVRFALWFAAAFAALIALPLLVISPHELAAQYRSWHSIEAMDLGAVVSGGGAGVYGGVMGQLRIWLGVQWPNWPVQLAGTVVLLLPLALRPAAWSDRDFRLRYLCSLLVYMVIFNQRSESPTFVIAVTGIAIWWVATPRSALHDAMIVLTILVVSVSSTEVVPHAWQRALFVPYRLKTVPCVLAWLVMQAELLGLAPRRSRHRAEGHELDVPAREAGAGGL